MKTLIKAFYGWYKAMLRNTKYRWIVVLGTLIYFIAPVDISPDLFPIVGWVDDGILATLLVTELSQLALEQRNKRQQFRVRPGVKPGEREGNTAPATLDG